jgi:HPt (histidine-containing phosphotransfer) domain-containing protein
MSDVLAGLRARFLERCTADVRRLDALAERGDLAAPEMRDLVHSLAGAAGTFGFPHVSEAAGVCDAAFADGGVPDAAAVDRLRYSLRAILARPAG